MDKKNKKDLFKLIIVALISGIFIVAILPMVLKDEGGSSTEKMTNSNTDLIYAYNSCMSFVKDKLKSPSSAVFPDTKRKVDHTLYEGNNTYSINSYVESQNGFGAMIRTDFSCTIYFENGSVYCRNLKFE